MRFFILILLVGLTSCTSKKRTVSSPSTPGKQPSTLATQFNPVVNQELSSGLTLNVELKSDERVLFLPRICQQDSNGKTSFDLKAWIFEPETDSTLLGLFLSAVEKTAATSEGDWNSDLFKKRAAMFFVDNESSKKFTATYKNSMPVSAMTGTNGFAEIGLKDRVATPVQQSFFWVKPKLTSLNFESLPLQIPCWRDQGVSVVSDIDDTIKLSNVENRTELIRNTFGRDFKAIVGASPMLKQLEARFAAPIHYLSSSPWQLFPELYRFIDSNGFPRGSFHLRNFRVKDSSVLDFLGNSHDHKKDHLKSLSSQFPDREFIFIGDSGEADPEIYAEAAAAMPSRVRQIIIRLTSNHKKTDERFVRLFSLFPKAKWQIVRQYGEVNLSF